MDLTLLVVPKPVECTANNSTSSNNCMNNTLKRKARPLCGSLIGLCEANHKGLVCGAGLWLLVMCYSSHLQLHVVGVRFLRKELAKSNL